jgi:hypothetical protein
VVRKELIRGKLDEMKSTQNFKGMKKLTAMFAGTTTLDLGGTGAPPTEPNSPAPV